MHKDNKAHTATANRIARRYGATYNAAEGIDIAQDGLFIEIETTATLRAGIKRLESLPGRVYVAVTNKEGTTEALRRVQGTRVGVMDPQGNVLKECAECPAPKTESTAK